MFEGTFVLELSSVDDIFKTLVINIFIINLPLLLEQHQGQLELW